VLASAGHQKREYFPLRPWLAKAVPSLRVRVGTEGRSWEIPELPCLAVGLGTDLPRLSPVRVTERRTRRAKKRRKSSPQGT
jgi:hypothetical protein